MHRDDLSERVLVVQGEPVTRLLPWKADAPASGLPRVPAGFESVFPARVCSVLKSIGVPFPHKNVASLTSSLRFQLVATSMVRPVRTHRTQLYDSCYLHHDLLLARQRTVSDSRTVINSRREGIHDFGTRFRRPTQREQTAHRLPGHRDSVDCHLCRYVIARYEQRPARAAATRSSEAHRRTGRADPSARGATRGERAGGRFDASAQLGRDRTANNGRYHATGAAGRTARACASRHGQSQRLLVRLGGRIRPAAVSRPS